MAWTSDNYNPDLWVRGVKLSHLAWHSCVLPKHQYTFITKFNLKALLSRNTYNFQQWMSRLPQRWWTQRNAIRNANCKTSWIIKILNAHCAFRKCLKAYLSECLYTPLIPSCMVMDYGFDDNSLWRVVFAWMYMALQTPFGVWNIACSGEMYFMYVYIRDCVTMNHTHKNSDWKSN